MKKAVKPLRTFIAALLLGLPSVALATGVNASHFSVTDDLVGYGDAALVAGNTLYTPDLDLSPSGAGQTPGLNLLQNKSLDEMFLKITFKAGVTPDISKLIEIRYGNEFNFTPGGQKFYSKVIGQDLLVWYGLQDRTDFGQTTVLTDSQWTFTIMGDHPVASVYLFISYHSNTATEMPDLLPLNYNHLYQLPEQTSQLFTETPSGVVQGKPISSAQKLIVLVHGWNPQNYLNKFAPDNTGLLSSRWAELGSTLVANPIVQQSSWTVARYDWSRDANAYYDLPRNALDAAIAHGAKLGQLVRKTGATHVQFIAHSAGGWAARRAAAYLKLNNPSIQIQITSLDPFVTDDLQPAYELTSLWTDYRDNFYVVDTATDLDTAIGGLNWTSGEFTGWNNANIEYHALYQPWMKDHAGPVSWYADTADEVYLGNFDLLSANVGFLSSLPVRLASAVNDNFPGQLLIGSSGSVNWLNYQATTQPSEPAHDPATHAWRSIWGRWTAPASGTATFDTFGGDFYDVLAAYTGSSLASLTQIAHDYSGGKGPGQCSISFPAVAGQTYYIAMDGVLGQAGQSPLHWRMSGGGPSPTVAISAPTASTTVSNITTVSASASGATKVEFYLDGVRQFTDAATPFVWAWNTATVTNGSHILCAKSYSGTALLATSLNRTVMVSNPVTSPGCPDVNEPNDSSIAATPLAVGASTNGYICSSTDVDWFKVTVTNSGTLSFSLTVPPQNDYDLEIYGPDYTFLKGSYHDAGQVENVIVSVTSQGTYFARVYGYPAGGGSYNSGNPYVVSALVNYDVGKKPFGSIVRWGAPVVSQPKPASPFTAEAIAAGGGGHHLALKSDGSVLAWGVNVYGQCSVPLGLSNIVAIGAGWHHSLALKNDGKVVAWGWNSSGQCEVPITLSNVVAIAGGSGHSMALKFDGKVVVWGDSSDGQRTIPSSLSNVVAIAAGFQHCLALKSNGFVVAWGNNTVGQTTIPTGLSNVVAIAAGIHHSVALTSGGKVVAWGANYFGQTNVPSNLTNILAIASGAYHNLALTSNGLVFAWGPGVVNNGINPDYGQSLVPEGLNTAKAIAAAGYESMALTVDGEIIQWGSSDQTPIPQDSDSVVAISGGTFSDLLLNGNGTVESFGETIPMGLTNIEAIATGQAHRLAIKSDSTVVAWGWNPYGQTNVPVGLSNIIAVAGGYGHSLALKADRTVIAWGYNQNGQTTIPLGLTNVVAIAAGSYHSLALRSDGTVVEWGYNFYGQVPVGLSNVTAIAADHEHSLALKSDGTVVAWGAGKIVTGGANPQYGESIVPAGLTGVVAIAAGWFHSLALKSDGTVIAWGYNYYGQTNVPVSLRGVTAISGGGYHSLALVPANLESPSIQTQPQSQIASVGQSSSFTVSVSGTPPFTYQWLNNGTNIAGATSATLTLANVQPAQAGAYSVQITGPGGTVISAPATLSFMIDANGNGLPDSWETDHALALNNTNNASADTDHDGASNMQEYLAGTDPQNSNSVFRITSAQMTVSGFQVTFTTVAGKTYRLECAVSPVGPWTVIENNIPGTGSPVPITDTFAANYSQRIYRITSLSSPIAELPTLSLVVAANNAVVSWPTSASGFTLEYATNLPATSWTSNAFSPGIMNGQYTVTNSISGGARFYRLKK